MRLKRWTRLPLAAVCGLAAVAAAAPAAQAQYPDPLYPATHNNPCENSGSLIRGIGASFARTAHLNWGAEIIAPDPASPLAQGFGYDVAACEEYKLPANGGTRQVTYSPAGSGAGRTAMGATTAAGSARNANVDFGGTDEAPTATQIANANEGPNIDPGADADDGTLHTIPIAQGAVAVNVRIPDGCHLINPNNERRLSAVELEGFYRGLQANNQFGELFGYLNMKASPGSGLTNGECGSKVPRRVVRFDSSGTTFQFKQYLQAAAAGAFDWREPSQGGTLANNAWPSTTVNAGTAGNGPLLDTLAAQGVNGGIGYADLGASRGRNFGWNYSGGSPDQLDRTFWVRMRHIGQPTYVSPAQVNDQVGNKGARCTNVTYANQPATTEGSWFSTSAVETTADYPLCALTYAMAWENPIAMGIGDLGRSAGRRDYLGYLLDRTGLGTNPASQQCRSSDSRYGRGQCKLVRADYALLPGDVFTKARTGVVQLGP